MSAGKVIVGLGAAGAAVGIGYLIWRHFKRRREAEERQKAEERRKAEAREAEERQKAEAREAEERQKAEARAAEERRKAEERQKAEQAWREAEAKQAKPSPAPEPAPEPKPTPEPEHAADRDPLPGPSAPLEQPTSQSGSIRLNRSHVDDDGTVTESPDELLDQARKYDPYITLDELTAARLAASEHSSGTFTELACIVDSELNRAKRRGKSLFESLTYKGTFGKQGKKRRASTRQDPKMRHLWAARAVLSGAARGVSRGAERFFDPKAMDVMNAKYRKWVDGGRQGKQPAIVSCDALGILEAWSFDYGRKGASRCPLDRTKRGRDTLAWVGPIPGVDALRLMLMKPANPDQDHAKRYQAARDLLMAGLGKKSTKS